jgi:hypothetical protein
VLDGLQREDAEVADRADGAAAIARAQRMGCVLDQRNAVLVGDGAA